MRVTLPAELDQVLRETPGLARAFLVGGCVRDSLLNLPLKDFDLEVFGVSYEQLAQALSRWGRTDLVGRSFGVVKLTTGSGIEYDFSIPRRDRKAGPGHTGFVAHFDPDITPREAAARRDFTFNALMYDPRKCELLDFFGGQQDLAAGILRHTSAAFSEDPLRVLRGLQFAGRFALTAAPATITLGQEIHSSFPELAVERVREEWFKWAARSRLPSAGLKFLHQTRWISHFPELAALCGTPQDPEWHPEGDVFIHTGHACDALAQLREWQAADEPSRVAWMLAVLAHDFGKPATTHEAMRDGRLRMVSPGHESAGGPLAASFLARINAPNAIRERVIPLVVNHLAHLQAITDRSVRRLALRLHPESIAGLCAVMTADANGRPPRPPGVPEGVSALLAKADELSVRARAPKPLLQGRDLIAAGLAPGPEFKAILDAAFEAQLDGQFGDAGGAGDWLSTRLGGK